MSTEKTFLAIDGNEAVADVAYRVSEISAIYPITPSSNMGEHADEWSSKGRKNIWDTVPEVVEMQSEGGASAALHGLIQAGALGTTYTASQGLLLMIPSMYKMAGELMPTVLHVSARSLAIHALSIFGDHSDVMATRQTGFAMLASNSVQEAHDFAAIAHAATLESYVPFLHFFDGFRTSHEVNKIEGISDEALKQLISDEAVANHRRRAMSPDHPVIRGTSQNPDVYFQAREACNSFYDKVPSIVENVMARFEKLTGRHYGLVQYVGDPNAERVIVLMGSGVETVIETVNYLTQKGEKIGVLCVHLYRPFPKTQFLAALPKTTQAIAVLDRTKEPGAAGEPLYEDILTTLSEAEIHHALPFKAMPHVTGGRYGLSSKEFTPAMVKAVFDELKKREPKSHFTVGIQDDVTHLSLDYDTSFVIEPENVVRAMFYGLGADGTVGANKNSIKIIAEGTDLYAQGYFVYDSKKSGSRTVSHLRFGPNAIRSPYLVQSANFVGVHQFNFVEKFDVLDFAAQNAVFLLNSPYGKDEVWSHLPKSLQQKMIDKKIKFYVVDAYKVARETNMGFRINTIMQTCFFALANVLPKEKAIEKIKAAIEKTYGRKGPEIVQQNFAAVDQALANMFEVKVPATVDANAKDRPPVVSDKAPDFVKKFVAAIMIDRGDDLPVSALPVDGTFPMATTKWEKRNVSLTVSEWDSKLCIQCGRCAFVCPHGVIRSKRYGKEALKNAPEKFKWAPARGKDLQDQCFTLQIYLEDCTGCGLCYESCPAKSKEKEGVKAINIVLQEPILADERKNIEFFETIPYVERHAVDASNLMGVQYLEPLFEFSGACAGCGETPYVKLVSQLFGDRMMVANATGCSSIYGGNLPTTPWAVNKEGRGPTWNNSLFEDNAEFGYGFRLSADRLGVEAEELVQALAGSIGDALAKDLVAHRHDNTDELIAAQRERVRVLKEKLQKNSDIRAKHLLEIADFLVKRSIWMMGGDGWAYDIGYGGLDHVLASGRDVNVLVLDTEVYSNTGGQASKATPRGAIAKFAAGGKPTGKKDLGMMAVSYGTVYVGQVSMGANPAHTLRIIREAESYEGPSIILAYSHCITHGINMQKGMELQKMAVDSGAWPLFHYDPRREAKGENPFVLDSAKPSVALKDYMYRETRFKSLTLTHPKEAETLFEKAQADVNRRFALYEYLAARKGTETK